MKNKNLNFVYIFFLGLIVAATTSCASNSNNKDSSDAIDNTVVQNVIDDKETGDFDADNSFEDEIFGSEDYLDFKIKKRQNTFLSNFGSSSKFCEYDTLRVFASNGFGKMKNTEAVMVYVPETNTFGFGANYLAAFYYVHFDQEGRNAFIKAVNQYFKDFENKRLQRNNSKTTSIYGTTDVYVNWGSLKAASSNHGTGKVTFGYKFVDKSPYFVLSFSHIYNKVFDNNEIAPVESLNVIYYFTKEYCKNMAMDLTDSAVDAVLREYRGLSSDNSISDDRDEY